MTNETAAIQAPIQRLDYSKPPPEYLVHDLNDDGWWWRIDEPEDGCTSSYEAEADCRAAVWAHYKAHNDPPVVEVHGGAFYPHGYTGYLQCDGSDARADAWAWYDRRLALSERLAFGKLPSRGHQGVADDWGSHGPLWPRCLTWSDEQVAEVERWLVDSTMELPEVLGGSAPGGDDADVCDDSGHVCTGCIGDGPCVALEAEIEAEERDADKLADLEAEFMDDGLCLPMAESEQPTDADGPLSRSRRAMSLSWDDLLRQHRDRSPIAARAVELAALRNAYDGLKRLTDDEEAVEAEIRRRLACDEVPTELETRLAQWRADNPPPTPEQMASTKAAIRELARRRKARVECGQGESGDPTGRDWNRQAEEHNATTLPLLNFSEPPPGYEVDCYPHEKASDPPTSFGVALTGARPLCLFADEGEAVAAAWSDYKLSHDPPGMWCGFSRSVDDLDNCSIRVGVHACGSRWELQPDITVPYDGFTVKARAWAWAWYERRHALMAKISTMVSADDPYPSRVFAQRLVDRAPFHRVLCWHNEWADEVDAWIEKPSSTVPEALR